MQKIIVMYRLKAGVNIEDFKKWSIEVDQKITPHQPGVRGLNVYEVKGGQNAPYQIVDEIDVERTEDYPPKTEAMERVTDEWRKYADESSLIMVYGDKIGP